jgi:hypothetical protein
MPADRPPSVNPFATRYTRPEAGEFLFPTDADADSLIARLRESAWWGQVTGPHGSGKSTLMQTLLPRLEAAGRCVELSLFQPAVPTSAAGSASREPQGGSGSIRAVDAEPAPARFRAEPLTALRRASSAGWQSTTQIVVDGYEQLSWLQRTRLKRRCRRRCAGLLVTAHRDMGLPPLWQTETSVELARRVVARLLRERDAGWLSDHQVEHLLATHQGNLREVLFALYDLYERHQRQ